MNEVTSIVRRCERDASPAVPRPRVACHVCSRPVYADRLQRHLDLWHPLERLLSRG